MVSKSLYIKDVCSRFSSGKSISASKIKKTGKYPVYGGNGIRGYTDTYNFDGECAVIGRQGAYCGNVRYFSGKGYMTEHAVVAVANQNNNTRFLAYKFALMNLGRYVGQSAQPGLSVETLLDVHIDVPSKPIQDNIANVLSTIDSQIENNNAICSDLEGMVKLLYDYWFVQFDFPDENGKPYKSSGGNMVWNEKLKREIPAGWEVKTLRGLYEIERGISYTSDDIASGCGVPMINLACIDRNRNYRDGELKYFSGSVPNDSYLKAGDLLIACTDLTRECEIIGCPILVPDDGNRYTYSMDIAKISFPSPSMNDLYMYMTLRTNFYHNYIKKWASGTNVLHLNLEGLDWYPVWLPPIDLQEKFARMIGDIHSKKSEILLENQQLISLRDFLLPMLMNGQITVGKAGK